MTFTSPLRYPGGKRKLANFIKLLYNENGLLDGDYAEPYAGGASIALSLLFDEYVRRVFINDLDPAVYAFWYCVLDETDGLCRKIRDTDVNIEEWNRQRDIRRQADASMLDMGYSTFFLNRTNRSGIITGGVIGGKNQTGSWLLDARFNKDDLIQRIQKIARYRNRIRLYNEDAIVFLSTINTLLSANSLVYLDPPYYVKGQQQLYTNCYLPEDHAAVARKVQSLCHNWIVSYDDVPQIRDLYDGYRVVEYDIHYSAQDRYRGGEVMYFCDQLAIPEVVDPTKVKPKHFQPYLLPPEPQARP